MTLPPVTLIVLNWNARPLLEECLTALAQMDYPTYQVVLVDNASSDDSAAFVRERFPAVSLVQNRQNLGFAAGNNAVLRESEDPLIALINPDVYVSVDWLRRMVEGLLADDRLGIAGCKLYYPGGRIIQHAGGIIKRPMAMPGHYGVMEEDIGQCDDVREVDYVIGAAVILRKAMLDDIGLFDDGYFLYFEDVDLCFRARYAGYRVTYLPQATAVHVESATSGKGSMSYLRRFHTSRWRFLLKQFEIDYLLAETLAAEKGWLAKIGSMERRAVESAYRANQEQLADIQARMRLEGRTLPQPVTGEWQNSAAQIFQDLRRTARQHGLYSLAETSGWLRGVLNRRRNQ